MHNHHSAKLFWPPKNSLNSFKTNVAVVWQSVLPSVRSIFAATHEHCSTLIRQQSSWTQVCESTHKIVHKGCLLALLAFLTSFTNECSLSFTNTSDPSRCHSVLCPRKFKPALWVLTEENISYLPPLPTGSCDPWPCHPCGCVYFHATNVRCSSWTQAANHHTPH